MSKNAKSIFLFVIRDFINFCLKNCKKTLIKLIGLFDYELGSANFLSY